MKHLTNWKRMIVILGIVSLSAFSLGFGGDDSAKKKRKTVYEYSTLSIITIGEGSRSAFDRKGKRTVMAADIPDLLSKLDFDSGDGSILAFMNHMGAKGWRFAEIEQMKSAEGNVTLYYFERTRRK